MFLGEVPVAATRTLPLAKFAHILQEAELQAVQGFLARYDEAPDAYLHFVEYLLDAGQPRLARLALETAAPGGAATVQEQACLALILWWEERKQEAGDLMARLFRAQPTDPMVNRCVGKIFLAMERWTEAIDRLEVGRAGKEQDPNLLYQLAMALKGAKRLDRAEAVARQALALSPRSETVLAFLSALYWETGRRDLGFAHAIRAIQLNERNDQASCYLAAMLMETGFVDGAVQLLRDFQSRFGGPQTRSLLTRLDERHWEVGERLPRVSAEPLGPRERLVVFVVEEPRVRQCKMAAALRRQGWKVVLLHRHGTDFPLEPYFDEIRIYRTEFEALMQARGYDPVAFHVFSPWYDETSTAFVKHRPGKVVYDYTDFFTEIKTFDAARGVEGQRFCLEEADGVCCRDLRARHAVRSHGWKKPRRSLMFMDYCWGEHLGRALLPKREDGYHVVSIGSFGVERYGQIENGYLGLAKLFADQGIHFHIYPVVRQIQSPDTFELAFSDYLELEARTGLVHMHRPVPMDEVIPEISQYHLGLSIVQALSFDRPSEGYTAAHYRYCGSTRVFDFLDAGLPVLLNKELRFQYHPLARYGLVLEAGRERLEHLREDLETLYHQDVPGRIQAIQAHYTVDAQIARLADWYLTL